MKVNEALRKRRIELGLSQKEVGDIIKVSQASLCRYENGVNQHLSELITHKLMEFYKYYPKNLKPNKTKSEKEIVSSSSLIKPNKKIREKRMKMGLSQAEVARKLGIDQACLCRYELGQSKLTSEKLKKIADFYNINYNFLIGDKNIYTTNKVEKKVEKKVENEKSKGGKKSMEKEVKEPKIVLPKIALPKIEITSNKFTIELEKLYNEELQRLSKGIEKKAMRKALRKYLKQIRG